MAAPKKKVVRKSAKPRSAAPTREAPDGSDRPDRLDPRVAALLRSLRKDAALRSVVEAYEARVQSGTGKKFGSNALQANGKLFALFTQATLVVKLPKARVEALVAEGVGEPFDPGHGRLMKEWLTVRKASASWVDLAKEAYAYVAGAAR